MADSQGSDDFTAEILRRLRARRRPASLQVAEQIDEGGMSLIYRAHDDDLRRDVALKQLREDKRRSDKAPSTESLRLGRFLDEVQVTAQLDHPGVVPVHDVGLDERERPYFTMKLVRGETLKEVFKKASENRDGWSVTRATSVVLKVCEAMSYAHSKQVIHRDLKPSNVMVGRFGEVFVMDWGLARVLGQPDRKDIRIREPDATAQLDTDRHEHADSDPGSPLYTLDGDVVGTPAYMSPEQANGVLERIDAQTDVYSVGAILYHLLTGQMPYVSPATRVDNYAIWRWVKEGPPTELSLLAPDAPVELVSICDKAMERDVAKRYASMQELADELRAYLEVRVVRAHASGPFVELRKWVLRNKVVAGLIALVVLALASGGYAVAVVDRHRAEEARSKADFVTARDLLAQVDELGPIEPASVDEMQAWLDRAGALIQRKSIYAQLAAALADEALAKHTAHRSQRQPDADHVVRWQTAQALVAAAEQTLHKRRERAEAPDASAAQKDELRQSQEVLPREMEYWRFKAEQLAPLAKPQDTLTFDSPPAQRASDAALDMLASIDRLEREARPQVQRRIDLARGLAARSLTDADPAARWSAALRSIADRTECPLYGGLALRAHLGLVPLRRDPRSGLWEFWHVLSGDEPVLGPDEHWVVGPATGIVLVLIPGGTARIGAQSKDPAAPRYDAQARATEQPWTAELPPYFVSKYEMTQGQWLALTGELVSEHPAGEDTDADPCVTRSNPVENVSQRQAEQVLASVGLCLPTEAQWECAARAGSEDAYVIGSDASVLVRFANLLGAQDGFEAHAPVGRFEPNRFGLYDVLGNVAEWCRDWYADSESLGAAPAADGERVPRIARFKVFRGACWKYSPSPAPRANYVRVSSRLPRDRDARDDFLGVRPARALEP